MDSPFHLIMMWYAAQIIERMLTANFEKEQEEMNNLPKIPTLKPSIDENYLRYAVFYSTHQKLMIQSYKV